MKEIGPSELKKRMEAGEELVILDVREAHELAICTLANTAHIPLGSLLHRLDELDGYKDKEVIVYCRSGRRSQHAAMYLCDAGFKSVYNLKGGILAWADQVDPLVAKY